MSVLPRGIAMVFGQAQQEGSLRRHEMSKKCSLSVLGPGVRSVRASRTRAVKTSDCGSCI